MLERQGSDLRVRPLSSLRRVIVAILALGYGTFLALVVFWPSPIDRPVAGLLDRVIAELHERGMPRFIDYGLIEFTANIGLFLPVGLVFGLLIPLRRWGWALMCGPAVSAVIEAAQRLLLADRAATIADVVANSIGATIGVLAAVSLRGLVRAHDARVIERHLASAPSSMQREIF